MQSPDRSIRSVRGKIVIALILACLSLLLAWSISRVAFREMLTTVKVINSPNQKLTLVNDIYRDITLLDQLHRNMVVSTNNENAAITAKLKLLNANLDSLGAMYSSDQKQQARIRSISALIERREQLFRSFLRVRDGLISTRVFSERLDSINEVVIENVPKAGPTAVTTIKENTYTRYTEREPESKGLLARIFGSKKKQAPAPGKVDLVDQELDISTDTIASPHSDTIINRVEKTVDQIRSSQRRYGAAYLANQAALADAGNKLTNRMMSILNEVENEVLKQSEESSRNAEAVVESSFRNITLILVAFVLITLVLLVLILTDISRSSRYRLQLESARDEALYHSAAKQRFLANISHELRTPLQAIVGYSELIKDQTRPDPSHLSAIYYSSNHLLQIVNEVLDYSRIVSGKFSLVEEDFNLGQLLDEVAAVMRIKALEKSLQFITDYEGVSDLRLKGDPFRLKQILFNLLGNAVKFTERGHVKLQVNSKNTIEQAHLNFRIEDTGRGIPKESIPYIFNEFDQGESSQDHLNSGSGLGLNIVRTLTEIQGGRIYAESEPGQGSSFILYLDYKLLRGESVQCVTRASLSAPFNGKVWIVDDDRFILEFCSSVLEKNQIPHRTFNCARAVLDIPWDAEVKYLFLDKRMPDIDGFDLLSQLQPRLPEGVKVYALTAQALPDEIGTFRDKGFDGVLLKPFREAQLLELLGGTIPEPDQVGVSSVEIDLSNLKAMTFGDEAEMKRILEMFIRDSEMDLEAIYDALQNEKQPASASLPIHRLAGRTGQMGAKQLAKEFRELELELNAPTLPAHWHVRLLKQISILRSWFSELQKLASDPSH